jgi:hypothetical protein
VFESIRNHKPKRQNRLLMSLRRWRTALPAATVPNMTPAGRKLPQSRPRIRRQEQVLSPEIAGVAGLVQSWAQVKKFRSVNRRPYSWRANEVTVPDTVYRAHPVTGELIIAGVDKPWRKTLADHKAGDLVALEKAAVKGQN